MICTQCEGVIPEGATECPHCGAAIVVTEVVVTDQTLGAPTPGPAEPAGTTSGFTIPVTPPPAAGAASSGPASPLAGVPQFKFNASRLSQADRIAGGATLVLFISLFLPWFSYRFGSSLFSGTYSWDGLVHGYLYITLIICLAIFAYLVALAGFEKLPFKMPIGHEAAILIATVINLLLTFIGFIDKPYGFGVGWSFGAFIALVAAIVAAAPLGLPVIKAMRGGSKTP
jgi:hypothetical protein